MTTDTNTPALEGFKGRHGPYGIEATASRLWIGPIRPDSGKVDHIITALDVGVDYRDQYNIHQEANARLLASSYDLALFAQKVANTPNYQLGAHPGLVTNARALLAKITGEA